MRSGPVFEQVPRRAAQRFADRGEGGKTDRIDVVVLDFRQVRLRDAHAPRQLGQRHPAFKHDAVEMHHNMRIIEALYHIRHSPSTMASATHAMASVHTAHMQGGPLFSGPPVVPPVGLEPTLYRF